MAFDLRNLISPVAPGLPGAVNPLAFIGAGMAQGNPLGALQLMGNLQLGAQRQNQGLMALQQRQQLLAEQMAFRRQQAAQSNALALARLTAPTSLQQNIDWAASLPEGDPRREMAMASITKPATSINQIMGGIPTGMRNVGTPEAPELQPMPGSPEDVKRKTAVAEMETMLSVISELEALVQQHGTEVGGDVAAQMEALRDRYIGNINTLRETGVLQESELKRLAEELPSPTGWSGLTTRTGNILTKYKGARKEVQDRLSNLREIYGIPEPTPPGGADGEGGRTESAQTMPSERPQIGGVTDIANDDEFRKLPPGALYRGPDGVLRRK